MKTKIKTHLKIGDKVKIITGNQKGTMGNISVINRKKELLSLATLLPRIIYKKNPQISLRTIILLLCRHLNLTVYLYLEYL